MMSALSGKINEYSGMFEEIETTWLGTHKLLFCSQATVLIESGSVVDG